jgi:hypothetical protein
MSPTNVQSVTNNSLSLDLTLCHLHPILFITCIPVTSILMLYLQQNQAGIAQST